MTRDELDGILIRDEILRVKAEIPRDSWRRTAEQEDILAAADVALGRIALADHLDPPRGKARHGVEFKRGRIVGTGVLIVENP